MPLCVLCRAWRYSLARALLLLRPLTPHALLMNRRAHRGGLPEQRAAYQLCVPLALRWPRRLPGTCSTRPSLRARAAQRTDLELHYCSIVAKHRPEAPAVMALLVWMARRDRMP